MIAWLVSSRLGRALSAIATFLAAILAARAYGRHEGRQAAERRELEDYKQTRKRMDEADTPNDADAADKFLRDRYKQRDL